MSIFDSLSGPIVAVLGSAVTIRPDGGEPVIVRARFRHTRVEIPGEEGEPVVTTVPTLDIKASEMGALGEGDRVDVDSDRYLVSYKLPSGSPSADRLETFVLRQDPVA